MVASANLWVKFFQAAGVPSSTAATYAHIFCENRMELDMLMDLNKEYLREMGISPMGDIIAILRHAKKVSEQNARERVLAAEKQSVATLSVSPLVPPVSVVRTTASDETPSIMSDGPPAKPARRVLPEHEGRYKVKLPSGTTERSKQILAKKASLADREVTKKKGIFDRLEREKSPDQTIQMTTGTAGKTISSSIFSRLGGKSETEEEIDAAFAGIFKSAPKKLDGVKKVVAKQKVILVKKIPAKAATMIADEYVNSQRMETGEKTVSFSTEDEILEIESRQTPTKPNKNRSNKNNNIRARLGLVSSQTKQLNLSPSLSALHRTQKTIKLKQPVKRANGSPIKTAGLKSDQMAKPVKSRLSLMGALAASRPEVNKLVNRIGRVSLSSRLGKNSIDTANGKKSKPAAPSSVFNRLGFNKK